MSVRPQQPVLARRARGDQAGLAGSWIPERTTTVPWWSGPLILLAAVAAQLVRLRGELGRTLWAEDGQIFLGQQLGQHIWDTVLHPYNGYMHLVPRLVAWLAAGLPLESAPWVMAGGALVVVALVSLFVFYASATLISSRWVRLVLALLVPLVPAGQEEAFGNIANVHWFLMMGALWALLFSPKTWRGRLAAVLVVLAAVLCDPMATLLLPVGLVRGRLAGWRPVRWPLLVMLAAGLLQAVAVANGRGERPFARSASIVEVIAQYWVGVVGRALGGGLFVLRVDGRGVALAGLATLLLLGLGLLAWRVLGSLGPVLAATGVALAGFPIFIAASYLAGVSPQRYAVAPVFMLYSGVALLVDRLLVQGGRAGRWTAVAGGILIAVIVALNGPVTTPLTTAPAWDSGLDDADRACAAAATPKVRIPIAPTGWYTDVPCGLLPPAAGRS